MARFDIRCTRWRHGRPSGARAGGGMNHFLVSVPSTLAPLLDFDRRYWAHHSLAKRVADILQCTALTLTTGVLPRPGELGNERGSWGRTLEQRVGPSTYGSLDGPTTCTHVLKYCCITESNLYHWLCATSTLSGAGKLYEANMADHSARNGKDLPTLSLAHAAPGRDQAVQHVYNLI